MYRRADATVASAFALFEHARASAGARLETAKQRTRTATERPVIYHRTSVSDDSLRILREFFFEEQRVETAVPKGEVMIESVVEEEPQETCSSTFERCDTSESDTIGNSSG